MNGIWLDIREDAPSEIVSEDKANSLTKLLEMHYGLCKVDFHPEARSMLRFLERRKGENGIGDAIKKHSSKAAD